MSEFTQNTPEKRENTLDLVPELDMLTATHEQLVDQANETQTISQRVAGKMLVMIDVWRHKILDQKQPWQDLGLVKL